MNSPRFWLGVALVLIGGVWFGQGMGWIGGGAMSGVALWAIVGPGSRWSGSRSPRRPSRAEALTSHQPGHADPVDGELPHLVVAVVVRDQLAALHAHRADHPLDPGAVVVDVADQHLGVGLGWRRAAA